MTMMLECNLELFSRVVLLANSGKSKGVSALALQSGLDRVRTILPQKLSWLHTQALIDRDREQTLTSKMIAHSRKAVDEDGRLCFVFSSIASYFIITNRNRLFHTLLSCETQHSAALAHLLHPRSTEKPSSLHWSSSYQPFARAVRTRGLTRVIQRRF